MFSSFRASNTVSSAFLRFQPRLAALPVAAIAMLCGAVPAQTAHFTGAVQTLGSGFSSPGGVAVDAKGDVFVADFTNNAVKEIVAVGGVIPASPAIVTVSTAFTAPTNVAFDASGNLYVTEGNNLVSSPVFEIAAVNGSIPTGNPTLIPLGSGFSAPESIAVDASGDVFVADTYNNAVKEIVAVNGSIPASPTIRMLGSGFSQPSGVAVDASGDVFVADSLNNAVKEMVASGGSIPDSPTINTLGSGFNQPSDLVLDASGDVFVVDYGDSLVKEIVAVGGAIPATNPAINILGGGFSTPTGIALDTAEDVYVADFGSGLVKEIAPSAGNFGQVSVGAASSVTLGLEFVFDTAGTLGSTSVVLQGATGRDFADAGSDTCTPGTAYTAGETCQVNVSFTPAAPGTRFGAAELLDSSGNVLATGLATGVGVGPNTVFRYVYGSSVAPPVIATSTDLVSASYFNVDAAGNLLIANNQHTVATPPNGSVVLIPASVGGYGTPIVLGSALPYPQGTAIDGVGNLYALIDSDANYDPGSGYVIEYPKIPGGYGAGVTVASNLMYPNGMVIDGAGNLFVASYANALVDNNNPPNGGGVFEIPWDGTAYGMPLTLANGLNFPYGVATDASGTVFFAEFSTQNSGNSDFWDVIEIPITSAGAGTPVTLATLSDLQDIKVDASGNVVLLNYQNNVQEIPRSQAPALSFATTPVGQTSSDSPQTITLENDGNAQLAFPAPASGTTPSIAPGFALGSDGTECPVESPGTAAGNVAPGATCTLTVSFQPSSAGSYSGSLVLTDTSLNAAAPKYATQTIALNGTATQGAQTITFTAPPSTVTYGAGAVTLSATASSGLAVSFGVTGPATLTGATLRFTGAGNVTVTASQTGNANYAAAASVQHTIAVQPALLTVTAKNAGRVYGKANPEFTDSITGYVNGDIASKAFTGSPSLKTTATIKSGAGTYSIVAGAGTLASSKYQFRFADATLTVTKAPLTVAANNEKVIYGQALPKLGYSATGFVNGDTKTVLSGTPSETTKAKKGSLPGSYAIAITDGTLKAANYAFTFKGGSLTIENAGPTAAPKFKPGSGTYTSTQTVTITDATPGALIYYTIDGATPTTKSTQYKNAISVSSKETMKAIAIANGYTQSAVSTATYAFK